MFKVGDKVRVTANKYHRFPDGTVGQIVAVLSPNLAYPARLRVQSDGAYSFTQYLRTEHVELIEDDGIVGDEDF